MFGFLKRLMEPKPLSKPLSEINWEEYLTKLEIDDQENVCTIVQRIQAVANHFNVSLVIMAVGSVLNRPGSGIDGTYCDIDLLLLPHEHPNDDRIEMMLETFALSQDETLLTTQPYSNSWSNRNCYDVCRFHDLKFPKGKIVQIFFYVTGSHQWERKNLREKLDMEAEEVSPLKKFAYIICHPV